MASKTYVFLISLYCLKVDTARILAVSATPLMNHQEVLYPIVEELAKRGHQITFITTHPAYPDGNPPKNLKEINLKDVSDKIWTNNFTLGKNYFVYEDIKVIIEESARFFEEQMKADAIQNLIKKEKFDLLILQDWFRPILVWSHIYKVPVVKISSSGMAFDNPENYGAPTHPMFYPESTHQRVYNLTFWETVTEFYKRYYVWKTFKGHEEMENSILKNLFGEEVPPLSELRKNAQLLLLNVNSFWDRNRPVPKNVVYIGQLHQKPVKELPGDIKTFLEPSQGAIYISIGVFSQLPPATIQMFFKVFLKLPYRVLWKFDEEEIEGRPDNVMIKKWISQSDVFRHPNLKLIITEGDLQTTEEAIEAGVPLIGIPMSGDQWVNVEHCVQYGFGLQLDMETVYEEQFWSSVMKVIEEPSYKENILRFRSLLRDTQTQPLDRAISWIEYVLKHSDLTFLKSPASNVCWSEYYELELLTIVLCCIIIFLCSIWYVIKYLVRKMEDMLAYQARMNNNANLG